MVFGLVNSPTASMSTITLPAVYRLGLLPYPTALFPGTLPQLLPFTTSSVVSMHYSVTSDLGCSYACMFVQMRL